MNATLTRDETPTATTTPPRPARVRVWDLPVRVFHWALAASFGAAYLLSESERLRGVHVTFGYTVLGLIAFRLAWGFVGTRHARFGSFLFGPGAVLRYLRRLASGRPEHFLGHNPAGSWAIWAILGLGLATGATGYLTFDDVGGEAVEELHEALADAWLVVVFVHLAGVLLSSLVHRENLVAAMLSGYKNAVTGADVGSGVPARTLAGLAAASAIAVFWIVSLLAGGPVAGNGASFDDADASGGPAGARQSAMADAGDGDDD
jgi:cytochrome b